MAEQTVAIRELSRLDEIMTMAPLMAQGNALPEAMLRERLAAMLAQGNYRCIAAYMDGRMVGVVGFWIGTQLWCGKYVEADHLLVDASLRSLGIGAKLMGWIEAEGLRNGCDVIRAAMVLGRDRTRNFYRRDGYSDDGLILVKPLSDWANVEFPDYAAHAAAPRSG